MLPSHKLLTIRPMQLDLNKTPSTWRGGGLVGRSVDRSHHANFHQQPLGLAQGATANSPPLRLWCICSILFRANAIAIIRLECRRKGCIVCFRPAVEPSSFALLKVGLAVVSACSTKTARTIRTAKAKRNRHRTQNAKKYPRTNCKPFTNLTAIARYFCL